jgi:hypothetical protein
MEESMLSSIFPQEPSQEKVSFKKNRLYVIIFALLIIILILVIGFVIVWSKYEKTLPFYVNPTPITYSSPMPNLSNFNFDYAENIENLLFASPNLFKITGSERLSSLSCLRIPSRGNFGDNPLDKNLLLKEGSDFTSDLQNKLKAIEERKYQYVTKITTNGRTETVTNTPENVSINYLDLCSDEKFSYILYNANVSNFFATPYLARFSGDKIDYFSLDNMFSLPVSVTNEKGSSFKYYPEKFVGKVGDKLLLWSETRCYECLGQKEDGLFYFSPETKETKQLSLCKYPAYDIQTDVTDHMYYCYGSSGQYASLKRISD